MQDPGSDLFPSRIQGWHDPGSGSASNNLIILNPKNWYQILKNTTRDVSSRIRILDLDFFSSRIRILEIPDQEVKKTPDPRSGSATLEFWISNLGNFPLTIQKVQFAYFTMCLKGFIYNNKLHYFTIYPVYSGRSARQHQRLEQQVWKADGYDCAKVMIYLCHSLNKSTSPVFYSIIFDPYPPPSVLELMSRPGFRICIM